MELNVKYNNVKENDFSGQPSRRTINIFKSEFYLAPIPNNTTGTVFRSILKSNQSDQLSIYSKSSSIHSLKSFILFLPRACQRHVIPGRILNRLLCQGSYLATSAGIGGLGPTRLISPLNTFQNCGSSSMLNFLKNFPTFVNLGSFFILKTGPCISLYSRSSLNLVSASATIVLNLKLN